ncbi:MAG: bifunctional demethylmenaquinone methyltransferase/2-methoxy-6-polyprenyl-1,4-benzoquinol methylase UbiE [Planctomycetes bacterium]|nr:bifunctional demethylmenaquinone methyltransferase/2-methoxy-6-polyprenyl-1,4-benzoquinol methylase UbiE [Planctomycetota bacterium]
MISGRKEAAKIRRMFAGIARRYDFLNHFLSLNLDRRWRWLAVQELAARPGERILDVCTGTADLALELAQRLDSEAGGHVFAADFCLEMLEIGEEKRRRRDERRVSFLAGDALRLPFRDCTFDAVAVAFGIRNVSDLSSGIRELARVLRPGGRLAILELATPSSRWIAALFHFYFHRILPRLGGLISGHPEGAGAYRYLPDSVAEFPRPRAFCAYLEDNGLVGVRFRSLAGGVAAIHVARRPAGSLPGSSVETAS